MRCPPLPLRWPQRHVRFAVEPEGTFEVLGAVRWPSAARMLERLDARKCRAGCGYSRPARRSAKAISASGGRKGQRVCVAGNTARSRRCACSGPVRGSCTAGPDGTRMAAELVVHHARHYRRGATGNSPVPEPGVPTLPLTVPPGCRGRPGIAPEQRRTDCHRASAHDTGRPVAASQDPPRAIGRRAL